MGATAFLQADPPIPDKDPLWTQTDGKDFASVISNQECLDLLAEHIGAKFVAALDPAKWHAPPESLATLDDALKKLPSEGADEWSETEADEYSYLYAELAGALSDFEYFHEGFFVHDLRDLHSAVKRAALGGATRVRLRVM